MNARESFWYSYCEMLYRTYYLKEYKLKIADRDRCVSWFVALATSASVAAWLVWQRYPALWSAIAIIVQFIGVIYPTLNYSKKEYALNLMIQDTQRIADEMAREWIFIDDTPDKKIAKMILDYESRYHEQDNKYLLSLNLRPNIKISESATTEREQYLSVHYPLRKEAATL